MLSAEEIVEEVYGKVKSTFGTKITLDNVVSLVTEVMSHANSLKDAPGPKKKRVATEVIRRLIAEVDQDVLPPEVTAAINLLLPNLIDEIISVFKHQVDLGSVGRKAKKFLCC